ncbi:uncharacterized protein N7496_007752 [Penicillium cataractarum]|uniref:Uncharacterized protein n=1 Tax=Penicillium cataractarum TaxID=2100454 RepID=A0A9W9V443_9EURO|nr:uncharacterized protein N7496_007752 [Penicillium cataractarum]KAJ5367992.1 hypothetical protein N7496_007752 [Penicillium cataractarum]
MPRLGTIAVLINQSSAGRVTNSVNHVDLESGLELEEQSQRSVTEYYLPEFFTSETPSSGMRYSPIHNWIAELPSAEPYLVWDVDQSDFDSSDYITSDSSDYITLKCESTIGSTQANSQSTTS